MVQEESGRPAGGVIGGPTPVRAGQDYAAVPASWARPWFAATALCAVVGVIISVGSATNNSAGFFSNPTYRALNTFAFFTVQSNLIVAGTTAMLAVRLDRRSTAFRTARLIGLVCISVTGIVYHVALADLLDLQSWDLVGDQLVHTVVPIMPVVGWLAFGPRWALPGRLAWYSLTFPVAWLIFTLARGAAVGFYPYPFIDVTHLGYARTAVNCIWVSLLLLSLAAGAAAIDRRLSRPSPKKD
jgi:hypothetical protein